MPRSGLALDRTTGRARITTSPYIRDRHPRVFPRVTLSGAVAALAVCAALVVSQHAAAADPDCKPDGRSCRTNQSCCGRVCVKPAAQSFGTCCTGTTCAAQGANCGMISDGTCSDMLDCGSCTSPETCDGGGVLHVCGCTPITSCPAGDDCGTVPDGCGGTVDCGTCTGSATCGGGGTPNVCGGGAKVCGNVDENCKLVGSPPCFTGDECATGCCCAGNCGGVQGGGDNLADPAVCSTRPVGLCNIIDFCGGNRNCQCPGAHCSKDDECCAGKEFCSGGFCTPKQAIGGECQVSSLCADDPLVTPPFGVACCCAFQGAPSSVCARQSTCVDSGGTCECSADDVDSTFAGVCPGAPCGEDSQCSRTEFCTGGVCTPKQLNSTACSFASTCFSGCCCATATSTECRGSDTCTALSGTCLP